MTLFSREELKALIEEHTGPCVSLFTPTHRKLETQQDQIRFKNRLREAEDSLLRMGLRSTEARRLLQPAHKLLDDPFFWGHLGDGLAVFVSQKTFRSFRLPYPLKELTVVTERFHLKPLLPLLSYAGQFYILAISKNEVRLLRGTPFAAEQIEVDNVPHSLAEALKFDQPEKQIQFHTRTPAGIGRRAAIFHGHGAGADDTKEGIFRYFRQIDKGLHELLRNERAPLVLAGVDYLLPIYSEANTYPHLLERGISGNPEDLRPDELHSLAWPVAQPHFERGLHEAIARYEERAGTRRASGKIEEIVPGAHFGRVESLIVAVGRQQWGSFDARTREIRLYADWKPGSQDLLDFAAIHTLLTGGEVHAVEPEKIPGNALLAACFRF